MANTVEGRLRVLDLFSGIGGFSLGLERTGHFETVAFCDNDPFCQAVLKKHWPGVPVCDDVRNLDGQQFGPIDVVCGGYPCQPYSHAGKRGGTEDDRDKWPEMRRVIEEANPTWVLCENVVGHINVGLTRVLADLEALHFEAQCFVVPACAVGAPHRRKRLFILAHTNRTRLERHTQHGTPRREPGRVNAGPDGPIAARCLCDGTGTTNWQCEPGIRRMVNGVSDRVDRLEKLGNAVVPQVIEQFGRAIAAAHKERT